MTDSTANDLGGKPPAYTHDIIMCLLLLIIIIIMIIMVRIMIIHLIM